jgi:glycosyltransferase involved in cell wall biosynthesis
MRIINSVLGDATGGRWRVVCDYSRLLADRGHQVLMLLGRHQTAGPDNLPPGVVVERVSAHGHYDFLAAWRLRRRLEAAPPDLAIAHCSRSVALLRRALNGRAPVLAVSHSNKVRRLLPADACLVLNQATRDLFEQAGTGKPCFVVPNAIAVGAEQTPGPHHVHQPPRIGALGRFDRVKGFDVFIDALAMLRDQGWEFEAILGGAGAERHALADLAAAHGLADQFAFPGWVDDVEDFLAELDILCVPARADAFGLTPLQAARAGVPMVLSNVSGHREMFEPEAQALFADVADSRDTARQLGRLISDPALAGDLRRAAFEKVLDCYSEPVVAEQISYIIEKLVNTAIL